MSPSQMQNFQVSRLWRDQVGSLKGLWLAQARRIGCQTRQPPQDRASTLSDQEEKVDWSSLPDEWPLQSLDIASRTSGLGEYSPGELSSSSGAARELSSGRDWKAECVAGLKLRHLLDAGKAWTHEELVNLVKSPGRCLHL